MRLCEIKSQERKGRRDCSLCLSHRTRELLRHIILASQTYRFSTGYSCDRGAAGKLHLAWLATVLCSGKGTREEGYEEGEAVGPGGDKNNTLGATNPFLSHPFLFLLPFSQLVVLRYPGVRIFSSRFPFLGIPPSLRFPPRLRDPSLSSYLWTGTNF